MEDEAMKRRKKVKSPYHITFKDALNAAILLVEREDYPKKPCPKCAKTIKLLNQLKYDLKQTALEQNLVWYAHKGERKLYIDPD